MQAARQRQGMALPDARLHRQSRAYREQHDDAPSCVPCCPPDIETSGAVIDAAGVEELMAYFRRSP
jgi:hypothetical protein